MDYLTLKSLHLIFVITWFAGLFYVVRLFVYQREALDETEEVSVVLNPRLRLMAKRLWIGITWPSAILALTFGTLLIVDRPDWLNQPFMQVKLGFVGCLMIYHMVCQSIFLKLQKGVRFWSSMKLRIWNEVATLILIAIVFLIVKRNTVDWLYGMIGLLIFAAGIMVAIRIYKKLRDEK